MAHTNNCSTLFNFSFLYNSVGNKNVEFIKYIHIHVAYFVCELSVLKSHTGLFALESSARFLVVVFPSNADKGFS